VLIVSAEAEAVIGHRDQVLRAAAAALATATRSAEPAQEEER